MSRWRVALASAGLSALLAGAAAEDAQAMAVARAGPGPTAARPASLTSQASIDAAKAYARTRAGTVAFAVLEPGGHVRGLHRTTVFPSASVVKAMLMVAVLRRAAARPLTAQERGLLEPMVTASDNAAALAVYAAVGQAAIWRVARAAHMLRFGGVPSLFDTQITAADQARLFLRIDRLVPTRHRHFARRLLSSIVSWQRWGIGPVARRARLFPLRSASA